MRGYVSKKTEDHVFSRKAGCLFLILAAVLAVFLFCLVPAKAAEAENEEESRAVTIVFDNSGSMYTSETWCDAIYSIEVFAALAGEGEEIGIYPLNPIEVDGITYTRESPLVVRGGSGASVIRDIYTPSSLDTHIETIEDAYTGLVNMAGEDKWLIVVSDADIYYENGEPLDPEYGDDRSVTQERLNALLSEYANSVNVAYLAIGSEATVPVIDGPMRHEVMTAAGSSDILGNMIELSNLVYGKDGVDAASDTLEIGQDLEDLVLFVQGSDVENLSLVDADGEEIGTPLYTCSLTYAEAPGSGSVELSPVYYADNAADTSLGGEIVAYGPVPAGTYTIRYEGSSTGAEVYYGSGSGAGTQPASEIEEDAEEITEDAGTAEAATEAHRSQSRGRKHRARFWVLIVLLIIILAAAAAAVVYLLQPSLPKTLRAKVSSFTLNGKEIPDIKRPYLRYLGGGTRSGRIIVGPRPGTTDFDYRLTLDVEARNNRFKKSSERGAVIVSLPTEIGNVTSYTIDSGEDKYTYDKTEPIRSVKTNKPKDKVYLGQQFTYTMHAQASDGTSQGNEETVTVVIELKFY